MRCQVLRLVIDLGPYMVFIFVGCFYVVGWKVYVRMEQQQGLIPRWLWEEEELIYHAVLYFCNGGSKNLEDC